MKKHITADNIQQYAAISKDTAAIHLNIAAAAKAGFKRPVAHGMYIMGLAQSLYLIEQPSQWITTYSMIFQKPLFIDTVAIFHFEGSNRDIVVTVVTETGEVIASGTFTVKEMMK